MAHLKQISDFYQFGESPQAPSISTLQASQEWQSKKMINFLDEVLQLLYQSKKGFKEFAFFVVNNSNVQQKLQEFPEVISISERFVQVGGENGYKFTEKDVKEIVGELCISMEELLSKLADWNKGGLLQFLNDIKNEPSLKNELDRLGDRDNFVTFLKKTFNQPRNRKKYKYVNEPDIEDAANLIPTDGKISKPENTVKVPKIVGRIWC